MSYQVIARKYRPQRFSDVVGQGHVTQTLSNAIQQQRIAHAYLFVGPRGTGKTTLARIFAKCLNCTGGPKVDFPDDDPRCQEITEGRALDVLEIDGASNRGIEEIRELRATVKYAPATSRFKIYIIDEVHMLTKEAFNALLKTLEEPPEHVKFMFATTEPEKVLPTILSRCQRFDLRRIPTALIVTHLASIAKQEQIQIDGAALYAIARGADGGMRDAESTLDQLISFCGGTIVESDVLSMFGLTSRSQVLSLVNSLVTGEAETALRELNELARNGKDLGRLLSELLESLRNLLIFQVTRGDLTMLEVPEAEAAALAEHSGRVSTEALTRMMETLTQCEARLREAASKKILIEVALLETIRARNSVSIDAVLKTLHTLRQESGSGEPPAPAPPRPAPPAAAVTAPPATPPPTRPAKTSEPAPPPPPPPVPASVPPMSSAKPGEDLRDLWGKIVEAVGRVSPFARTYLLEAYPVSLVKNVLTIGFDPEFSDHLSLVDNSKNRTLIQTKLHELGCRDAQVKFVAAETPSDWLRPRPESPPPPASPAPANPVAAAAPPPPKPEPAAMNKNDFKNDPLIKQALEIFKGTIVEVRA